MATTWTTTPNPRAGAGVLDASARCFAVVCLVGLIFATFHLFDGAERPFLAFSVIGAAAVHAANKPRPREMALTLALAGAIGLAYFHSHGGLGDYRAAGVVGGAAFLGLASLLVLAWKACRATDALAGLLTASFCPVLMIFTNLALALAVQLSPKVFDLYLYRFDRLFGVESSFLVGQWFVRAPLLYTVCFLVYGSLPLAEVFVFLLFLRGCRMPANPLISCAVAGIAGFVLFQICPAAGPVHVFMAHFPQAPPGAVVWQAIPLPDVPRNAIPSLHSAWAILIFWNLRHATRWARSCGALFLMFTLLATLGLGEHYLIDLVVAVPFAVAVQTACRKQACRKDWFRAITALALTTGWVVYLRFSLPIGEPSRAQAWAAVLATLVASAVLAGIITPSQFSRRAALPAKV